MGILHNERSFRISNRQHIGRMRISLHYENVRPIAIPIVARLQVTVKDITGDLFLTLEGNAIAGPVIISVDMLDTHTLELVNQRLLLLGDVMSEGNIRKYTDGPGQKRYTDEHEHSSTKG